MSYMKDSIEYTTLRTENKLLRACIIKDTDQEEWREEYTMSELWKKNVLGGRPS